MAIDGAGAAGAVRELFESSIALGRLALAELDVDPREVEDVETALRQLDETRLAAQMDEGDLAAGRDHRFKRSEEHTFELQSLMRISYAVFCLKKKKHQRE